MLIAFHHILIRNIWFEKRSTHETANCWRSCFIRYMHHMLGKYIWNDATRTMNWRKYQIKKLNQNYCSIDLFTLMFFRQVWTMWHDHMRNIMGYLRRVNAVFGTKIHWITRAYILSQITINTSLSMANKSSKPGPRKNQHFRRIQIM